jgi:hypothetical protein
MTAINQDLLADWKAVQDAAGEGWLLPDLERVYVHHRVKTDASAGADAAVAADEGRGWVRYQSASFEGSMWSGDADKRGRLIWAEWAEKDGAASYRLTPDPANPPCSVIHEYREHPDADGDDGRPMLAENVTLQGFNGQVLHYRVYWGVPDGDSSELRRLFARFVRIGPKQ